MIEIKIKVDNIDYESIADMLAPMLKDRLDSGELPAWARLLFVAGGMNGDAFKKILSRVPKETMDEFVVKILNEKSDKAADLLEDMASSKGIRLDVVDVKAALN